MHALHQRNHYRTVSRPRCGGGFLLAAPPWLVPADCSNSICLRAGVYILAAFSPQRTGLTYEFLSGSSMSSAFIAGIGALLRQGIRAGDLPRSNPR